MDDARHLKYTPKSTLGLVLDAADGIFSDIAHAVSETMAAAASGAASAALIPQ